MFVIGIAGGSGSGKTTILDRILRGPVGSSIALLAHDAYYLSKSNMPADVRNNENWDHPDALDNDLFVKHLDELKMGRDIDRPVYNFATHSRSQETIRLESRPVILVDGILLFSIPAIANRLDLKLFVDTPSDLRIVRRLARDISERGRTVESVTDQYQKTVRPMHDQFVEPSKRWADVVIPWEFANDQAIRMIESTIREHMPTDEQEIGGLA
jgi:uridine kinase